MRKLDKRWTIRLGSLALTAALLGTSAALASGGGQTDPLVTLSYLNQTAVPQIVQQVEAKTAARQTELEQEFSAKLQQYRQEAGQGVPSAGSASYALVTMSQGQTMTLEVGCEVLLRVGTATVKAGESPALIDLSSAGTIDSGAPLAKNHLYLSTIAGRAITASGGTVKVLVRGGYALS